MPRSSSDSGRVPLPEPHRPVGGLERPEAREVGLDVLDGRPRAAGDPPEQQGRGAVDPGAEGEGGRDEVRLHAVHVLEPVAERAAEIGVELGEAHVRLLAKLGRHHGESSSRPRRAGLVCEVKTGGRRGRQPSPAAGSERASGRQAATRRIVESSRIRADASPVVRASGFRLNARRLIPSTAPGSSPLARAIRQMAWSWRGVAAPR